MIDYIYLFAYMQLPQVKMQIDALEAENEDVFYLGRNIRKICSNQQWKHILDSNKIQKLVWKLDKTEKLGKSTVYSRILSFDGE